MDWIAINTEIALNKEISKFLNDGDIDKWKSYLYWENENGSLVPNLLIIDEEQQGIVYRLGNNGVEAQPIKSLELIKELKKRLLSKKLNMQKNMSIR